QVGRFTCELSLNDKGKVQAQWLPWQPKYLNKDERMQYRVARAGFLERANPGSIVDVVDRLSGTDPRVGGTPKGVRVSATPRGSRRQIMIFAGSSQRLSGLLVRSAVISLPARQGAVPESGESHLASTDRCCRAAIGRRLRESGLGSIPVRKSKTTAIPLILPSIQAMALAQFVKRVDFETVARFAAVTVVWDGKSEADLIWLALIALRRALAEASVAPR